LEGTYNFEVQVDLMINGLSISSLAYSLALTIALPVVNVPEVFPEETMDL